MGYEFSPLLERLVRQRIVGGQYASEDEALLDAMLALESVEQREEELKAEIQRRIGKAGAGLSQPLDRAAFKAEARGRFGTKQ
jgi:Arc/MetJ-type ribon-helix-helix transcriptional regulator